MIVGKKSVEMQPDGARWVRHTLSGGAMAVTTTAFEKIMGTSQENITGKKHSMQRDFWRLLQNYKRLARDQKQGENRGEISNGAFAKFYKISNSRVGIREEERKGKTAIEEKMLRMDRIHYFLEISGLPRWIKSPSQYGYLSIPNNDSSGGCTDYLLMEKIDSGITVEDIKNGPRTQKLGRAMLHHLGKNYGFHSFEDAAFIDFQKMIIKTYEEVKKEIFSKFIQHREELWAMSGGAGEVFCFEDLFSDFAEKNIVIDILNPPIGGKKVGFWIIDQ